MGATARRRLAPAASPPRDRFGAGATLVTLHGGPPTGPAGASQDATMIARVRRLVNALPACRPGPVCPDDLTAPSVLPFYRPRASPPYAGVGCQLGGCPTATVTQGARVVAPPPGGPLLLAIFGLNRRLIDRPTPTT